jgi:Ca2+-binding RTX toxin-like protein
MRDAAMTSDKRLFQPNLIALGDASDDVLVAGDGGAKLLVGFEGADSLTGSSRSDVLIGGSGDDTLSGAGGNDSLRGGLGNDTYVDPFTGTIVEAVIGGVDTVTSIRTFSLAGLANVEHLTLTGHAAINGTGNGLANILTGNSAANRLEGGAGADTLIGGGGNDIYVNVAGDTIRETADGGTDTILSSTTYSLSGVQHVENVTLTGAANINATGNFSDNVLTGNSGANRLRGSRGEDTLDGGSGADTYVYGAAVESTGADHDTIVNMALDGVDKFDFGFTPTSFGTVLTGKLDTATFNADLATAVDARLAVGGAVIFDPSSGDLNVDKLAYLVIDVNGDGAYQSGTDYVIELLNRTGVLTADDFI